jgi:hypothetical protein
MERGKTKRDREMKGRETKTEKETKKQIKRQKLG